MYRHDGQLVAEFADEHGTIEVVERLGLRLLHFGTPAVQSCMQVAAPDQLQLPYVQAMVAALMLNPHPRRILLIGLGAGSLAKFLLDHDEHCLIDAVELRPTVVKVAHTCFGLPHSPRLRITTSCGARYVSGLADKNAHYDMIFVDAFTGDGVASPVTESSFFSDCHRLLGRAGVLVMNLWRNDSSNSCARLVHEFDWRVALLSIEGRQSVIGFCVAAGKTVQQPAEVEKVALTLEQRYQLPFRHFLDELRASDVMGKLVQAS